MLRCSHLILVLLSVSATQADEIDFAHDVVPVLKKHCAECHAGEESEGGFSFNTQRQLLGSGYAKVRQPDKSRIVELIQSHDAEEQMPPKEYDRLSAREIKTLQQWIAAGVPWEPGFRFSASGYEPPLLPRDVVLPSAAFSGQNPIDRILYGGRNGVTAEVVENDVFLRRAYLDLIGLPPSLEEQTDFLNDARRDRRRQLIESLLGRDRDYAEHWITFWNDLLRNDYAGTGYIDGGRRQITAWLYEALVKNKPYDQFVRELIAPTAASDGFISGIKWRGTVNASQVREIQFAQNVAQVFLGINMKCASCHDSFIDRWTLDEAYGLAAIYSTRELQVHRCDKPVGRIAKAAWIFPEIGDVDPQAEQRVRLQQLAAVMTSPRNGRFSRTVVNRLWHRLMGHGIVHPVDAMHTEPWNADLLDYLANYLVDQEYDMKKVLQLIATSQAYQSRSAPAQDSATSGEFTFRGPVARHLTAEQLMDGVWSLAATSPSSIDATLPAELYYGDDASDITASGQWIWTYANTASSPAGERAAFRKQLTIAKKPRGAVMVITCDNEYTAWVNGKKVGGDKDWNSIEVLNLSRHLKNGANEILIVGRNAGAGPNLAGLYAEIVLTEGANKYVRIATDETWQASRQVPKSQQTETVPWQAAVPVDQQNTWVAGSAAAIKAELASTTNTVRRRARAALLKSNMLMRSLGRPNREQVVTTRPASLSTLQAIDLANGELLDNMLSTSAQKLLPQFDNPESFVRDLFRRAIMREPSVEDQRLAESILGEAPSAESVQDLLWLLVMLPEFQFVQ
ncbi:MAG: DUF1549 domain-containing protein [Fuerstiella sp.]|nr:DUF1549 domain-containing protein [Fuerstiella sp.]MCP4509139.1 DUF1549 domain-containing protein [Fuerstiella sp.]